MPVAPEVFEATASNRRLPVRFGSARTYARSSIALGQTRGVSLSRIQVHPDGQRRCCQQLGSTGDARIEGIEAQDGVIVRHNLRGACAPCSHDLDSYLRIGDQVLNVRGRVPVMGDDPEHIAVESIADGCPAWLPGLASYRLEKNAWISGVARAQNLSRIDQTYLQESHQPPLHGAC